MTTTNTATVARSQMGTMMSKVPEVTLLFWIIKVPLVESKLVELLESEEDAPPPEGLDMSQVNFEFAGPGVFGPGGSGTFAADFEEGKTYVALCFIQDREGGAPHAS